MTTTTTALLRSYDDDDDGSGSGSGGGYVDAEFERIVVGKNGTTSTSTSTATAAAATAASSASSASVSQRLKDLLLLFGEEDRRGGAAKSLLDWGVESDPALGGIRIPFFAAPSSPAAASLDAAATSTTSRSYIDARLAFLAELDGVTYAIGVPYDPVAAIAVEQDDGEQGRGDDEAKGKSNSPPSVTFLSPQGGGENNSDDDGDEITELMAAQLHEHLGEKDLYLQRTPRALTIKGPLDRYVSASTWQDDVAPKPADRDELLSLLNGGDNDDKDSGGDDDDDDDDDDLKFFHDFMREELGDDEYERTLQETPSEADLGMYELFDIPGYGTESDDVEGMKDLFESTLRQSPERQVSEMKEFVRLRSDDGGEGSVALKLISYIMKGKKKNQKGKCYSLVLLLKPVALVAKCTRGGTAVTSSMVGGVDGTDDDDFGDIQFELLSPAEERIVIPELERVCVKDLEQAGLTLTKR